MYITLICKPTHQCNLNCQYCYDKKSRISTPQKWDMTTVDRIAFLIGNSHDKIQFNWHGGECLTMGLDWIINSTLHIKNVAQSINPRIDISFGLQSNGILLNEQTINTLINNKIYPSISYDGQKSQYIRCPNESINNIIKENMKKLLNKEKGISSISVISNDNIDELINIYEEIKSYGASGLSFNNIFPSSIKGDNKKDIEKFTQKWNEFFDYWLWDKNGINERTCSVFLKRFFNNDNVVCEHGMCLNHFLCIDAAGNVYPCDSSFKESGKPEYIVGNIYNQNTTSFFDILESDNYKKYKATIIKKQFNCFTYCDIYQFCKGGCPAKTLSVLGNFEECDDFTKQWQTNFIIHIFEKIKNLTTEDLLNINPAAYEILAENGYISLNDIESVIKQAFEAN